MSGSAPTLQMPAMPITRRTGKRPFPPRVSSFTRPFWDALSEGHLITTCCDACGRLSFPPKPVCRDCWSEAFTWRELRREGRLYSFTRVDVVPRAFGHDGVMHIGIVDLADGIRLMCRVFGDAQQMRPDAPANMIVMMYDDGPLFGAEV